MRRAVIITQVVAFLLVTALTAPPVQASVLAGELAQELEGASPEELLEIVKANVHLTGDLYLRMTAQNQLERLGKEDPQAVVPLVIKELSPPRSYGKIAGHQRLAMIELLRDLGPAAEAGTAVLVDILADSEEPYDSVKMQAASALGNIGTPQAEAAAQAYYAGLQQAFAASASPNDITRSVEQSAFLIRQELRSREPSDRVILASLDNLSALGKRAAPALPTLLRTYSDPRLGAVLHQAVATVVRATGEDDVEGAAARAAQRRGVPDILTEVIAETRHDDPLVRGLAMTELGRLGASEPAIEAMIVALREDRSPGDAAAVLGDFGEAAARALPDITAYFDDERSGSNAIQAVGKIGVKDPVTIAKLRQVLGTIAHRHRGMAASALGTLGAVEALPELRQTLGDGGKYDRILAAKALARLGPDAAPAMADLSALLEDPDLDLRRFAVVALGQIGSDAAPAIPDIAAQLESGDKRLSDAARQSLVAIGGPLSASALDRDAGRFATADLAEARRLATTHGMEGMSDYLFDLPARRATPLAHQLLLEEAPDSAYIGALFLARQGEIEPAIPILADNLARRPDSEKMFTGLAWSMMHGGDEPQIQPLIEGLRRYIEENRDRYTPEEKARLDTLFMGMAQ